MTQLLVKNVFKQYLFQRNTSYAICIKFCNFYTAKAENLKRFIVAKIWNMIFLYKLILTEVLL